MERQEVLAITESSTQDALIKQETNRLQKMRDNDKLPDPSTLPVLEVERVSPVTPHMVTLSAEVIIRNAALKAIGDCKNFGDETNAKANIEEAQGKLFEANSPDAAVKVDVPPVEAEKVESKTTKTKATK